MREILFSGKRADSGEWISGMPCATEQSGIYAIQTMEGGIFDIIPESVSEFSGLCDKNGKKIFEGDIVKADGYIFTVKFGKCGGVANDDNFGYMGFYFEGFDEITKKCMDLGLRKDICYFVNREVIGNIHDNPELLKGDRSDA
jgi:uncharacterized phage protein (TIGR01671 family)